MLARTQFAALIVTASCAFASQARAHICMDKPVSRVGPSCTAGSAQKPGPCGINTRSTQYVTEFKPGETITVEINETINHGSHYRIAFNPNGDEFEDPANKDEKDGKRPFVLLDGIVDESAAKQSVKVTLPNMTCDNCTLQLIQVMYDKGGNGFGNDDIYYSCADIVLKGTPSTAPDAGGGSDAGTTSDASAGDPARPLPDGSTGIPPVDIGGGGGAMGGRDSGSGAPLPPVDAGSNSITQNDAGSGATPGGGGTTGGTTGGQGHTAGGHSHDAAEEDEGGCSIGAGRTREPHSLALALALGLAALLIRRRQRG